MKAKLVAVIAALIAVAAASAAGVARSAYNADYVGSTVVAPQQISASNFYTDVSLSAQSATATGNR